MCLALVFNSYIINSQNMTKRERKQLVTEFKEVFLTREEAYKVFLTKEEAKEYFLSKDEFRQFTDDYYKGQDLLIRKFEKLELESAAHWDLYGRHDTRLDRLEGAVFKT